MATPLRHHADDVFAYPRAERDVSIQSDVHAVWLAVGRAIFGGFFLFSGINHFMSASTSVAFVASKGVPFPQLAILGTGALLVAGGLSLILGVWPRIGASLIILFLVGVTPVMHDFWNTTDPQARMNDFGHFLKNVALIGGACLAIAVPEPWPGRLHLFGHKKAEATP